MIKNYKKLFNYFTYLKHQIISKLKKSKGF